MNEKTPVVRWTVCLSHRESERYEQCAKDYGLSKTTLIRQALRHFLGAKSLKFG